MPTFTIYQETDALNPREAENKGRMLCKHRRYILGDVDASGDLSDMISGHPDFDSVSADFDRQDPASLFRLAQGLGIIAVYLELHLYDHSGITMSTIPFSCAFDSGQVGVIYMTHSDMDTHYGGSEAHHCNQAKAHMKAEVKAYNAFISEDTFGFLLVDDDGTMICERSGYEGCDIESNGMLNDIDAQYHELVRKSVNA